MSLQILLVDDHVLVRAGLSRLLGHEPDMEVVGEASSGEEAVRLADELGPDVVLMDINLPGGRGIEAIRQLKEHQLGTQVLILTALDDRGLVRAALEAGASGYLLKRASVVDLFNAIHTVTCGGLYVDPAIGRVWLLEPTGNRRPPVDVGDDLTPRQVEILRLVARGYTTPQIAEHLFISARTVEYHRRTLADKLHLKNRAELVHFASEHGLLSRQGAWLES
ncbi:MAG: response regulator transcription factor [Anaerolineae bacterium]